jgi:hypothetical protein
MAIKDQRIWSRHLSFSSSYKWDRQSREGSINKFRETDKRWISEVDAVL